MKLFKDLSANLDKILMQVEKSKIQLENTIDSGKTSIINIKDVKLNIQDLKINNDKSNKAFQESKFNQGELLKLTDNYLKNPTPEKALKVKNQINVSNDYLKIATDVSSENKIFANKVVVSFNKYKNNDFISNIKKLIEWNQRLIASLNKNINLVKSVGKLKIKTQTREIYSSEASTLSPDCQELKEELAGKIKERDGFQKKIDKDYLLIAATIPIAQKNKDEYEKQTSYEETVIKALEDNVDLQKGTLNNYNLREEQVKKSNEEIIKSYVALVKALVKFDVKIIKNILNTIEIKTKKRDLDLHALQNAIQNLGSANKQSIDENEKITKESRKIFTEKNKDIFNKMKESQSVITEAEKEIKLNKEVVKNYNESIKKLEDEIKLKNCL